jgi:hypothetical protein
VLANVPPSQQGAGQITGSSIMRRPGSTVLYRWISDSLKLQEPYRKPESGDRTHTAQLRRLVLNRTRCQYALVNLSQRTHRKCNRLWKDIRASPYTYRPASCHIFPSHAHRLRRTPSAVPLAAVAGEGLRRNLDASLDH